MPDRPTLNRSTSTDPSGSEAAIVRAVQANGAAPPPGFTKEGLKAAPATTDDADLDALWIDAGVGDPLAAVHLHKIPVGKPRDFFRTCNLPGYRQKTMQLVFKPENAVREEYYLVAGPMRDALIAEARPCVLIVTVDRIGAPRIWPLTLPRDDENDNDAWRTARAIAREGETRWTRMMWHGRRFISRQAEPGYAPEPDFSKLPPFKELVQLAYGNAGVIRSNDHPVYRALFGAATPADGGDVSELDI